MKRFLIKIDCVAVLTEKQLFPDGAPPNVSESTVRELIAKDGEHQVIDEWSLASGVTIDVKEVLR